jgi:hypothetical protein
VTLSADTGTAQRRTLISAALIRIEDVLLALWVAVVAPLLLRAFGASELFPVHQPVRGVLYLASALLAVACIAARRHASAAQPATVLHTGALGPLTGGLLLVVISAVTALDATTPVVWVTIAVVALLAVVVHVVVPPLTAAVRRALVTPFVLVCATIFWNVVDGIFGSGVPVATQLQTAPAIVFFATASAVFYAMLVYAPHQVAVPDRHVLRWVLRYIVFAAGTLLGINWPHLFG